MSIVFEPAEGKLYGRSRPPGTESPIRTILGHVIYRRPDRCPVCRGQADLYLTGLPDAIEGHVWTWRRPHPACEFQAIVERLRVRAWRVDHVLKDEEMVGLGRVWVEASLRDRGLEIRSALERHCRGDFGIFGRLVDPPEGLAGWCEGAYPVEIRNALVLRSGRGLVWSRTPDRSGWPGLVVLTALTREDRTTLVIPAPEVVIESPEGLPDLMGVECWASGRPKRGRPPKVRPLMINGAVGVRGI